MYVPDTEYLVAAVDPGECDRLPEPVREREPGGHCWAGDCCYGSEHGCGGGVLQGDGKKAGNVEFPAFLKNFLL